MLITKQDHLNAFCAAQAHHDFITVDTEFLREKTYYSKLCLIQIGNPSGEAAAIDPLAKGLDLEPVLDLMRKPDLLKIFHAGRQDLEIFFELMGEVPAPFFDTQIAAMVCGYGDQIGYERLVRDVCNVQLDKSTQFTDWSRRPLSEKQINYALGDVTHLVKIFQHMTEELERRDRTEWVFEEERLLADVTTYENDPYKAWERVKIRTPKPATLAVLREVAAWRESEAQRKNIPRGWVMRDDTLADMAAQAPTSIEALSKIRNMPKNLEKLGPILIEHIERGLKSPKDTWPKIEKKKPLPPAASAALDILKMLMKIQCALHDVAPKLLGDKDDLETLALGKEKDNKLLQGWRYKIFGKEALDLKSGKLAIGLKNGEIVKYNVENQ